MGKIITDLSGELRKGVFYRFRVQFEDAVDDSDRTAEWIVVPRTPTATELAMKGVVDGDLAYIWAQLTAAERHVQTSDCPLDKEHVTYEYFEKSKGEAYGGKRVSPFIPTSSDQTFVITGDLRQRIETPKIRGARIDPLALTRGDIGPEIRDFWTLQFVGNAKKRLPKFVDAPNKCPHCGKTKIMCEGCGDWTPYCNACKMYMIVMESRHEGKADQRIPFEKGGTSEVLDGKTWDGSDLVQAKCVPFASKRFIDWLLRIHAAPFYAEPVWFCVDGMNDQQKKWFDDLQKPFEA
jgi:hypothetical protein